ncbi:enoyl-CoA hydratase/isomerase family protein [Myxococcota bacterium]|nr:enoyl-CoA hydratase/isomerase family protein [Myxococcota bacterium]
MSNVRTERSPSGTVTVVIDREDKRNALDRLTCEQLEQSITRVARDESTRVILLRGAGDRAFCAGADLREIQNHESIDESRRHFDGVARVIGAMQKAGPPVIARVPGYALAGGCGLAVAADFTIASESARFGLPEIGLGLLPLMVSAPIYRALGSRKALLDLVLTGRQIGAREAEELGLVTRVVADDQLDDEIEALCNHLTSLSPAALRMGKEAIYTLCEMEQETSMRYLREAIVLTSRTQDAQEGVQAFFEKREPKWTGT